MTAKPTSAILSGALLVLAGTACSFSSVTPAPQAPANRSAQRPDVTVTPLYSFTGKAGKLPYASLVPVGGVLYGTTTDGGGKGKGAVFRITTSGAATLLHGFSGAPDDGANPYGRLVNAGGTLFGTTSSGGANDDGTIFKITPSGIEKVLHSFGDGTDGANPNAGLTLVHGVLYGTTQNGGTKGYGTLFRVTRSGQETVLYNFKGGADGASPQGDLTVFNDLLYGTTFGDASSDGTVFSASLSGDETVLHDFSGSPDGAHPVAGPIVMRGNFYGTTTLGGAGCGSTSGSGDEGCGTVYKMTPAGSETVVHSFAGGYADGAYPYAMLTNVNGTLYGTTAYGYRGCYSGGGCGALFTIDASGVETIVATFGDARGGGTRPHARLTKLGSTLYGTAYQGGRLNVGTVYAYHLP